MYSKVLCCLVTSNTHTRTHAVSSYDPKSEITLQALCKLEAGAAIPVLTKLESELLQFRKRANIRELYAFKYARNCPVVDVYINSWLNDSESVPSTWGNFLVILKDIGPKDIADDISSFLSAGASITEQGMCCM